MYRNPEGRRERGRLTLNPSNMVLDSWPQQPVVDEQSLFSNGASMLFSWFRGMLALIQPIGSASPGDWGYV